MSNELTDTKKRAYKKQHIRAWANAREKVKAQLILKYGLNDWVKHYWAMFPKSYYQEGEEVPREPFG